MKHLRLILYWGLSLAALWLALCLVIGELAAVWSMHPARRALTAGDEQLAQSIALRNHALLGDIAVTAEDGVTLRGWSIRPSRGNGDAVILLHGVGSNRAGMLGYADLLLRHGFAVLLPDARALGESGGELATYGVKETEDVRRWFDWLHRTESPRCIDALGNSMGAGAVLESLKTTPGFCAVAAESPYASFREISYDRLAQRFDAPAWVGWTVLYPAVESGFLYARLKYGVDLDQDSPADAVAASRVPVLLIHGKRDENIPPRQSERILARSSGRADLVLWEPAEAGHCGAVGTEPKEYERRVIGWFGSHDAQH
jgi:fermentation-respiration switch protein FrsA (DUF1100 family)